MKVNLDNQERTGAGVSIDAGLPGFSCSASFFEEYQKELALLKNCRNTVNIKDLFDVSMLKVRSH